MSMGSLTGLGGVAGAPYAQRNGTDAERRAQDAGQQTRQFQADILAEKAAGIGQTDEDQHAGDRDADGRRLWETPANAKNSTAASEDPAEEPVSANRPRPADPHGESGNSLDLSG